MTLQFFSWRRALCALLRAVVKILRICKLITCTTDASDKFNLSSKIGFNGSQRNQIKELLPFFRPLFYLQTESTIWHLVFQKVMSKTSYDNTFWTEIRSRFGEPAGGTPLQQIPIQECRNIVHSWVPFLESPIFSLSVSKSGEVYTPKTSYCLFSV